MQPDRVVVDITFGAILAQLIINLEYEDLCPTTTFEEGPSETLELKLGEEAEIPVRI